MHNITEELLSIFDFFEPFVEANENRPEINFARIRDDMVERDILRTISHIWQENDRSISRPFINSFRWNARQFVEQNQTTRSQIKWKKVLYAYINTSRFFYQDIREIDNIIANGFPHGEEIIFAVGLVDIENDKISVIPEINDIIDSARRDSKYYVLPAFGCTIDVFGSIMKKYKIENVHLAGHCNNDNNKKEYRLIFLDNDKGVSYQKFCMRLNGIERLVFLNCCNTYELVGYKAISNVVVSIVHEGLVGSSFAKDTATSFYKELIDTKDMDKAWNSILNIETPFKYHCLL
jgi:hypothetical protein